MAAPSKGDPEEDTSLDLTAVLTRERFRIAILVWLRRQEAFFRRHIGWEELVYGVRRRVRREEIEEEE